MTISCFWIKLGMWDGDPESIELVGGDLFSNVLPNLEK